MRRVCQNCGKEIDNDLASFCPYCVDSFFYRKKDEKTEIRSNSISIESADNVGWVKLLEEKRKSLSTKVLFAMLLCIVLTVIFLLLTLTLFESPTFILWMVLMFISLIGVVITSNVLFKYSHCIVEAAKVGDHVIAVASSDGNNFYVDGKIVKTDICDSFEYTLPNGIRIGVVPSFTTNYGKIIFCYIYDVKFYIVR